MGGVDRVMDRRKQAREKERGRCQRSGRAGGEERMAEKYMKV